jgi:TolB-like protein/Tfp pilus assembly protein PilF
VLAVLACAAVGGAYFAWMHRTPPVPQSARAMLVVLPFENLTGNPDDDYICDGFTEEMITQLGALNHDQLGVIARTSAMTYKDGAKPIKQIAQELGVNYPLEGSVRKMGDGLRVTAQLIRADDQTHLWAHSYDRSQDDLEKLEGELAQDIAHEVQIQLTPQAQLALSNSHTVVPEAYRSYLKGRFNLNMRSPNGMKQATEAFEEAIREDPTYAPAYSGLADTYNLLIYYGFLSGRDGIPKARAAAQKAVELDDTLAEGHASLGYVNLMWDMNWAEADKQFQRAIELDGSYSTAHHWYALLLAARGDHRASLAQIRESQRLDPRSLIVATAAAYVSYFARDDAAAAALCHDVLQRDPNFMVAHAVLGLTLEQQGNSQEAIAEFQKALQLSHGRPAPYLDYLGHAYAAAGQRDQAEAILAELDQTIKPGGISPMYKAATLTALGRTDQALDSIEEGFQGGGAEKIWLKADPRYRPLHGAPRYERLVRLAGMTQ